MIKYRKHFKICEEYKLFCEYQYYFNNKHVEAKHVIFIKGDSDNIDNMIALSDDFGMSADAMRYVHKKFLKNNPYQ